MNTKTEPKELFNETNIVGVLKSLRLAEHVWKAKDILVNEVTVWKPDRKRPTGRPRQRWNDRVKEDLKHLRISDGETRSFDREAWRDIVKMAMGLNRSALVLKCVFIFYEACFLWKD